MRRSGADALNAWRFGLCKFNAFVQKPPVCLTKISRLQATGLTGRSVSAIGVPDHPTRLAVMGKTYRLTRKESLTDTFWGSINGLEDFLPTASGSAQLNDPNGGAVTRRDYRIEVVP